MLNGAKLKGGFLKIHCARCPARLTASDRDRAAFALALEERGWRMVRGSASAQQSIVCPDCAKKVDPKSIVAPAHVAVP